MLETSFNGFSSSTRKETILEEGERIVGMKARNVEAGWTYFKDF
jgi:hypothetical protein